MVRHSIFFILVLFMSATARSQPKIGFRNLSGFPAVVSNGVHYDVAGYIANTGQDSMYTGVDILMRVNDGPAIPIQNNFTFNAPLAPGDSIFWSKGNHCFPVGQFAPGNNDVIIWPTRMQGPPGSIEIDSLGTAMFFAGNAAFVLCDQPIPILSSGADLGVSYTLDVCVENAGRSQNTKDIGLYMQIGKQAPVVLMSDPRQVDPGQQFQLVLANFMLLDHVDLSVLSGADLLGKEVVFWVEELTKANAVNRVAFPIVEHPDARMSALQPTIFPNPVTHEMHLRLEDVQEIAGCISIGIYSIQGQLISQFDNMVYAIDMAGFKAGHYLLVVHSRVGRTVRHFIKE